MRRGDTKKAVQEHFRKLLREELARGGHGTAAAITKATGIKSSHISNMISHPPARNPGLDAMHSLARYWGRSYAELEAEALGAPLPAAHPETSPGLAAFLRAAPDADEAIVELLRRQRTADKQGAEYFRDAYERIRLALEDAWWRARAGAYDSHQANDDEIEELSRAAKPESRRPRPPPARAAEPSPGRRQ